MESQEPDDDDAPLVRALRKRNGRFVWRLLLRLAVMVLLVAWLLLSDMGRSIGHSVANGFGSLTGQ